MKKYIIILISLSTSLYASDQNHSELNELMQETNFYFTYGKNTNVMQLKSNVKYWEETSTKDDIIAHAQTFLKVNEDARFNIYPEFKESCNKTAQFMLSITTAPTLAAKNILIIAAADEFPLWQATIKRQRQLADESKK